MDHLRSSVQTTKARWTRQLIKEEAHAASSHPQPTGWTSRTSAILPPPGWASPNCGAPSWYVIVDLNPKATDIHNTLDMVTPVAFAPRQQQQAPNAVVGTGKKSSTTSTMFWVLGLLTASAAITVAVCVPPPVLCKNAYCKRWKERMMTTQSVLIIGFQTYTCTTQVS